MDYHCLKKIIPQLSAAILEVLEVLYKLKSKAAKWYAKIDTTNVFFSIPLAAHCRPQIALMWKGVLYTWD